MITIDVFETDIDDLIKSLLGGLACYGELLRLEDRCNYARVCGDNIPDDLQPVDPFGTNNVVSEFAEALQIADRLRRAVAAAERHDERDAARYRLIRERLSAGERFTILAGEKPDAEALDAYFDSIQVEAKAA